MNAQICFDGYNKIPGLKPVMPQGAMYMMVCFVDAILMGITAYCTRTVYQSRKHNKIILKALLPSGYLSVFIILILVHELRNVIFSCIILYFTGWSRHE